MRHEKDRMYRKISSEQKRKVSHLGVRRLHEYIDRLQGRDVAVETKRGAVTGSDEEASARFVLGGMAHQPVLRVVSLLPSATDTVNAVIKRSREDVEALPFELCGCTHECDLPNTTVSGTGPVRLTRSRIGDIPIDDIELAFNSSVAAIDEFMTLRQVCGVSLGLREVG